MGKKTNWTGNEDQALCRAWLCASEAALAQGDQKAGTFWSVVHQLFHAEIGSCVERPVNGLKIRWTRVNRDVQRFALTYNRVQAAASIFKDNAAASAERGADDTTGPPAAVDALTEQRYVNEATEQYLKEQGSKFAFEACWRMLRFSSKWTHLLASATGISVGSFNASPHATSMDATTAAPLESTAVTTGVDSDLRHTALMSQQKRRLASLLEGNAKGSPLQLQTIASSITSALQRQNELLEEQNAIALFRMNMDSIEDSIAREYFSSLRQRYVKKMRKSVAPGEGSVQPTTSSPDVATATRPSNGDMNETNSSSDGTQDLHDSVDSLHDMHNSAV